MKQIVLLLMMCFPTLLWGNEVVQNGISYSIDEEKETADDSETKQNEEAGEATDKPAYPIHESGLVTENQQQAGAMIPASSMMQAETFCPHCGTRVKLGVVMIRESK